VKKTTSAIGPSGKDQNRNPSAKRTVVTQLHGVTSMTASDRQDSDIDLAKLRASIDEVPEMNATKLVALHRRIVNGDYKIDSETIASKLLELESQIDPG